ncbi:MAG: amidohydrolase family protein [Thermoanaerobaculales bacterium]|jgi:5-methylthioadenosine/S-adenosylhomocysteine deaminase|nr:amidohydrolase family protein [Thermoanaerobaculales bacterium]
MSRGANWDILVLGGTVLTMEPGSSPIRSGAVAIADGRIAAVGPAEELLEMAPSGEVLNAGNCLILPGLVNTHSHLAMTVLRGIADDLPLKQWLESHIWPAEKEHMSREVVRVGTELAVAEQLLGGVTTTTDMYFFGDEVCEVLVGAGMRGVVAESLIGFATPRCAGPDEMLERQRELIEAYRDHHLITPSVAAHAPYSVSAADLVREAELAEEYGVPMQIHLAETRWEVEKLLADKGMSPVAYLADLGVLSDRTVAAHCVHVSPEDIGLLAEFETRVSHNPVSNLKLASGVSPVPALVQAGVTVGLGTDGAASNNGLNLLRDMQLAALLHKGVACDPTVLPARAMVEMATSRGARVLGLDSRIGTLSEGLEADLICVAVEGPHAAPMYDPFSHLVFAARATDVRHVMIGGRVVVRNRVILTLDRERVESQVRALSEKIRPS